MSKFQKLIYKLKQKVATSEDLANSEVARSYYADSNTAAVLLSSFGLPLSSDGESFYLTTEETEIANQEFCFVDIETNGSNPAKHQIIEIAAIKTKGNVIIDSMETLVYCNDVSVMISEITGINCDELKDKPNEREVIEKFRSFLANSVFVAHNVDFDFGFLSQSMQKYDLPPLLNRKLCTINLAKRTIQAERYGLKHLAEVLNLEGFLHHRAYSDTLASFEVFKRSLENIPADVKTVEQLIDFSTLKPVITEGQEA